jgi:hypothetical protein
MYQLLSPEQQNVTDLRKAIGRVSAQSEHLHVEAQKRAAAPANQDGGKGT